MPALQELTKAGIRLLLNGDASQWDRAMRMPHYNPTSMPAISLHTGMHMTQVGCEAFGYGIYALMWVIVIKGSL